MMKEAMFQNKKCNKNYRPKIQVKTTIVGTRKDNENNTTKIMIKGFKTSSISIVSETIQEELKISNSREETKKKEDQDKKDPICKDKEK